MPGQWIWVLQQTEQQYLARSKLKGRRGVKAVIQPLSLSPSLPPSLPPLRTIIPNEKGTVLMILSQQKKDKLAFVLMLPLPICHKTHTMIGIKYCAFLPGKEKGFFTLT